MMEQPSPLIQSPYAATIHPFSARSAARRGDAPRPARVEDGAGEDRVRLRTRRGQECDCGQGIGEVGARTRDIATGGFPGHDAGPGHPAPRAHGTEGGWYRDRDDETSPGETRRSAGC